MPTMKFYQGALPAQIWSEKEGRVIVKFEKKGETGMREFETDDEKLQKLLIGMGYVRDEEIGDLERLGTLPHGGFQKILTSRDLPSGRKAAEQPGEGKQLNDPYLAEGDKRPRQTQPQVETAETSPPEDTTTPPEITLPDESGSEKKSKRVIKRRKK